jgi:hypothetical protein
MPIGNHSLFDDWWIDKKRVLDWKVSLKEKKYNKHLNWIILEDDSYFSNNEFLELIECLRLYQYHEKLIFTMKERSSNNQSGLDPVFYYSEEFLLNLEEILRKGKTSKRKKQVISDYIHSENHKNINSAKSVLSLIDKLIGKTNNSK